MEITAVYPMSLEAINPRLTPRVTPMTPPKRHKIIDCMRIFHNLFSNIEKYADNSADVVIHIQREETQGKSLCHLRFENKVLQQPRKNESAKVGLESLRALMTRQGGHFQVKQDGSTFCAILTFPVVSL